MIEITVSNDNYNALLCAKPGEEIKIGHVNCGRRGNQWVLLSKVKNIKGPVEMTIGQIEEALGHKVKIVGGR